MTKEQVLNVFNTLSKSQGFYGRLLNDIRAAELDGINLDSFFEQFMTCKDAVDVILTVKQ